MKNLIRCECGHGVFEGEGCRNCCIIYNPTSTIVKDRYEKKLGKPDRLCGYCGVNPIWYTRNYPIKKFCSKSCSVRFYHQYRKNEHKIV